MHVARLTGLRSYLLTSIRITAPSGSPSGLAMTTPPSPAAQASDVSQQPPGGGELPPLPTSSELSLIVVGLVGGSALVITGVVLGVARNAQRKR